MATSFPTGLDALTNPTSGNTLASPDHAGQHADANDAIEALEAKVGVNGSAVTSSLDYKVTNGIHSALNVDSGVLVVDATNNRVGVNTASPVTAVDVVGTATVRAAATQDGVALVGRAGGTSSYEVTLTPTTLSADRTLTLPDATGTVALTSDPGLILIKTQTVGSAVSSVTVTSAFSSTYDNYLITLEGGTISADGDINIKLGASATGYYAFLNYGDFSSNTPLGAARNNQTQFNWVGGGAAGQSAHVHVQVFGPNKAAYTKLLNGTYQSGGGYGTVQGEHRVATAYTDFILTPGAGTLTGGTIRVYGYRNS